MASPHVELPRALRLPPMFQTVPGYLALHDPDLRVRRSVERPGVYVIERRCRRAPAIHCGQRNGSDLHIQARDGYIHVASTNAAWLLRPWNIVRALRAAGADLWEKGADQTEDDLEYQEKWQKESARRRRRGLFRGLGRELYDALDRHGNADGSERMRLSSPAGPRRLGGQLVH
jgi:hypothetical protein